MTEPSATAIDLIELHKAQHVNHLSGFCEAMKQLDLDDLVSAYHHLVDTVPRRHSRGKNYFVGHSGVPSTKTNSNRCEEHLALALWNWANEHGTIPLAGAGELHLIDYQVPLKAKQADRGIGKVDLFGVMNGQQSCVIELKIKPTGKGRADTPLRAFLEGLAYCAMVQANAVEIAMELADTYGFKIQPAPPVLLVMAPEDYWTGYLEHARAGDWWPALRQLAERLHLKLGLQSYFVVLANTDFSMGTAGGRPQLAGEPRMLLLETFMAERR